MLRRISCAASLALTAVSTGCLTDTGSEPLMIARVASTDQQQAPGGSRLPLRVTVATADGTATVRGEVLWSILSQPGEAGDGSLSDSLTLSDGTGLAEVELTLGRAEGVTIVRAVLRADRTQSVDLTITATRTPVLTSVSPTAFGGGDQIVVSGRNLDVATGFEVGGVVVGPIAVSGDGGDATLLVPQCLTPGQVAIRAFAGTAVSDTLFGDFAAAAGSIALAVGEHLSLSPSALEGCAMFPPAGASGAEYLLAVQSVSGFAGDSAAYRLRGIGASPSAPAMPNAAARSEPSHADRFHFRLREFERELAQLPPARGATAREAPPGIIKPGVERIFRVCSNVRCAGEFATVRAEAKYVGRHAVIYQDLNAPAGGLGPGDFDDLGEIFDLELYDVATRAFGAESDIDGDDRVAILLTPVVNSLTEVASCDDSFIAGFFLALDINPGSVGDPRSNQAEVFYSIVPDPEGEFTCAFTVDQVRRQVPVTFIHEFQHMISFHQHVMLRGGVPEELWLNEGLSHLLEELAAQHFLAQGDTTRFQRFAIGNLINAYDYLLEPGDVFVLLAEGGGTRQERGAAWLFLRWVVDQFGEDVVRRMSETGATGSGNVGSVAGVPFGRLLSEWFLANWVSDLPDSILADSVKPDRLKFSSWRFRITFASFNEQLGDRFPKAFPIDPRLLSPAGFDQVRTLRAGSGDYYRVVQPPNDAGFVATFTQPSGQVLVDAAPRLNVIRIR